MDLVNGNEVVAKLRARCLVKKLRLLNVSPQLSQLLLHHVQRRDLEALPEERIADSRDSLSDLPTLLEDNDVD